MTQRDRRQILRDRIDQVSIVSVKLVLNEYSKSKTFSYKEVEDLLVKCNTLYKEKLAELLRIISLESKQEARKSDESKEKIST